MGDDLVKRLREYAQVAHMAAAWGFAGEGYTMEKAASRIEELEAEVDRLREALGEAIYMLAPEAEDILKGAGIYRIVQAHKLSGGFLPDDLKDALQEVKEKSDE